VEKFKEYYPKGIFSEEQLELLFDRCEQMPDNRMHYRYHFGFHINNTEMFNVFIAEIDRATEAITVLS
jgi:hypothetical protein